MKKKSSSFILALVILLGSFFGRAQAAEVTPTFDSTRSFQYLKQQCSLGPRNPGSTGHLEAIAYFKNFFKQNHIPYSTQEFIHADAMTGQRIPLTNFIITFKGKDTKQKPLLFCAHWDSRPRADQEPNTSLHNTAILGANDGASGIAVLMELASLLSQKPPKQTIHLAFFDGEDYGREGSLDEYFLGAKYFADNFPVKTLNFAILLDMIGDSDLQLPYEGTSLSHFPDLTQKIWAYAQKLGLKEFTATRGVGLSDDHVPLIQKGVKAIDIIDFTYPYWHTLQDTPEHCSAHSLGVTGRLLTALAYHGL